MRADESVMHPYTDIYPLLASRSSSRLTSPMALVQRISKRSTRTPTPLSERTRRSSPPRSRRIGPRRAKSTGVSSSLSRSARRASKRRSRLSRPNTRTSKRSRLPWGCPPLHVSLYAHPYVAYDPKTRLCYCHAIIASYTCTSHRLRASKENCVILSS